MEKTKKKRGLIQGISGASMPMCRTRGEKNTQGAGSATLGDGGVKTKLKFAIGDVENGQGEKGRRDPKKKGGLESFKPANQLPHGKGVKTGRHKTGFWGTKTLGIYTHTRKQKGNTSKRPNNRARKKGGGGQKHKKSCPSPVTVKVPSFCKGAGGSEKPLLERTKREGKEEI